ncbi:MAG: ceramide glucosyltransferase [Holophagae bacterium]|jgi:ceramide glucosyltransferase
MVAWTLMALTGVGLLLTLVMLGAQRRQLRAGPPPAPGAWPAVSILKPLKGADADLEANLETFLTLDYPRYEVIFGVASIDDPALEVARAVAARHPEVMTRFAVGGPSVGHNPKVNNLANIVRYAQYDALLISDSNVAVERSFLRPMVARLEDGDVGLVTSFIRGIDGSGLGGSIESLQLNTFVMGGVAAVGGVLGQVCAVGKSMLLRRDDLDRIGGFAELGRYLAEDQICGELIRGRGRGVVVCGRPVDNVLGRLSLRDFSGRHLRWARIRRRISPLGYSAELLTNPLAMTVALLVIAPGVFSLVAAAACLVILSGAAAMAEGLLGVRRPLHHYPPLLLLRSLLVLVLWPVPFVSSSVVWRGRSFRIGPRTLLQPETPWLADDLADLNPEEAVA